MSQPDTLIKAFALRAFLEMDWGDVAPPAGDINAWMTHWRLLQAVYNTAWDSHTLDFVNASWASDERFDSEDDLRRFIDRHRVSVRKSLDRVRWLAGLD